MKVTNKYIALSVMFLILLSCHKDISLSGLPQKTLAAEGRVDALDTLLPSPGTYFINVVNPNQCFYCSPVYSQVAETFKKAGTPSGSLLYVFPDLRKVLRKSFVEENLPMTMDDARFIFSTALYNELQKKFDLRGASGLVKYRTKDQAMTVIVYERNNFDNFVTELENAGIVTAKVSTENYR